VQLSDVCLLYSSSFALSGLQGVQPLLNGVLSYLPCPVEVSNYALDQTNNEEKVFSCSKFCCEFCVMLFVIKPN
jgi:translation elongation factor EF-G